MKLPSDSPIVDTSTTFIMRIISHLMNVPPKLPKSFHNLPDKYVKRQTQFIEWMPPKMKNFRRVPTRWRKEPYYDIDRPWTEGFRQLNAPNNEQPKIFVQPFRKFPVLRGDRVVILVGRDAGKQGIVNYIVEERNWVFVEKLNLRYEIIRRDYNFPGSVSVQEMPLLYPSEVKLVDPSDNLETEGEWRYDADGNDVRVSVRTEREIPIPQEAYHTYDYKDPTIYEEEKKDTKAADVEKVTYMAEPKTFEMDIMNKMGIRDDRKPWPMFWY